MKVNEAEKLTGLPKKTIKYYEEEKLISPKRNSTNRYREYSSQDIKVLNEIKLLRKLGFKIENIRNILNNPDSLKSIFEDHINEMDMQVKNLSNAEEICRNILSNNNACNFVDFAKYLEKISNMEQEGYEFMNENVKEKKFKKDSKITGFFLAIFVLAEVAIIIFAEKMWIAKGLAAAIIIILLVILVKRHSNTTGYICSSCKKRFTVSTLKDLISLHNTNSSYLKCPYCGKRTWAKESYKE